MKHMSKLISGLLPSGRPLRDVVVYPGVCPADTETRPKKGVPKCEPCRLSLMDAPSLR